MGDNYLYEISNLSEDLSEPFIKKEIEWVVDENKGSYNGSITFDCAKIANSGKWASWQESILTIPFTIMVQSDIDITASANAFMVGLRNGFYQLVNAIQLDLNNTNCVQLTQYLNHYVNYKLLTTLSQKDVDKWGSTIGFSKDCATSFNYSTAGVPAVAGMYDGIGISNNRTFGSDSSVTQATAGWKGSASNHGFYNRLKNVHDLSTTGLATATSGGGLLATAGGPFITKDNAVKMGKSIFYDDAGVDEARLYYFDILATIRMKDLSEFIDKFPLTKGSYFKLTVNYNSSKQSIHYDFDTTVLTAPSLSIPYGKTNPLIVASASTSNPNETNMIVGGAGDTTTMLVSCDVGKVTDTLGNSHTHSILQSCRITVPLYTMTKEFEDTYISMNPTKEIVYKDVFQKMITGKVTTDQWNEIISTGIAEPLSIVVIPYLNSASNGNLGYAPYQSPFSTEGGTTSPLLTIKDFNVLISGSTLFNQNITFDYDMFLNEVRNINSLNGGNSNGLTSGLISQQDFEYGYRYYVADISRRLPLDDTPKTIRLMGTNSTGMTVDYLVFIEYVRRLTIDIKSGAVVA